MALPFRLDKPLLVKTESGSEYELGTAGNIVRTTSSRVDGAGWRVLGAADDKFGPIDAGRIGVGRRMRLHKPGSSEGLTSPVVSIQLLSIEEGVS